MNLNFSQRALQSYKRLPLTIQKKADKQFNLLLTNYRHPSLRTSKMSGVGYFEARIDIHYRFTFLVEGDEIYIMTVGPHDKGLGKK